MCLFCFLVLSGFGLEIEGKRLIGRPLHRWEDNIKIYLKETGQQSIKWIDLAQCRKK
jgi:hypothetical protein